MKIKGKKPNFFRSQTVTIQDDTGEIFTFILTPPSIDFHEKLERAIPSPIAPRNFAKDGKGKIERDENGRPVIIKDEDDKAYRERLRETQQLHSSLLVYEGLKNDKNIEFETKFEEMNEAFAKAIKNEMVEMLPMAVFLKLVEKIGEMMSLKDDVIKEAEESFRS
jgi:hypothetical protein